MFIFKGDRMLDVFESQEWFRSKLSMHVRRRFYLIKAVHDLHWRYLLWYSSLLLQAWSYLFLESNSKSCLMFLTTTIKESWLSLFPTTICSFGAIITIISVSFILLLSSRIQNKLYAEGSSDQQIMNPKSSCFLGNGIIIATFGMRISRNEKLVNYGTD